MLFLRQFELMPSGCCIIWELEKCILFYLIYVIHNFIDFNEVCSFTPVFLISSDGSPNFFNLSWYDRCLILVTSFVALLWTFSIAIMSFLYKGAHTDCIFYG